MTLMGEQEISAVFWRVGIIICNPELSLWLLSHQGCALKKTRVHEIIFFFAAFQVQFVSTLISVIVIHVKIMENVLQMLLEILVVTVALGGLEKLAIQTEMSAL